MEPMVMSIALVVLLILFVTEKFSPEISALLVVFGLVLLSQLNLGLEILTPQQAMAGLANDAVVTVAAMFVISAGLMKTGVVGFIGDQIMNLSKGSPQKVMITSVIAVAVFSSFINNTPVVVLFVPMILRVCYKYDLSPSKYLIPISYASILGGTATLIGTSTNILVAGVAHEISAANPQYGIPELGMFDITAAGGLITVAGIILVLLLGHKLLPNRVTVTSTLANIESKTFMTELEIQPDSAVIGKSVKEAFIDSYKGIDFRQVIREEELFYPPVDEVVLQEGDILLTKGTANEILKVQRDTAAIIAPSLGIKSVRLTERNMSLAEAVVMPRSRYVGNTLEDIKIKRQHNVNVIAILRKGRHMHIKDQIHKLPLAVGDTLLVQGGDDALMKLRGAEDLLLLEGIGEAVVNTRKAPLAVGVLASVVIGATFNIMPIMVLAVLGALFMIVTHCVSLRDVYRNIDASVLLLIASTISLGTALENTGTATIYGDFIVGLVAPLGPVAVIGALFLLTSLLTQFMSNNATAVIMTHIAVASAVGLGYAPMPFIIAVLFGASACYATPIGYQTNLFVYGPGGYRFSDFAKLGIPLNLLVMILATLLIPVFWPLAPLATQ